MSAGWREIADRVFVRRHQSLDLNIGLVLGDDQCLVVDTRSTHEQASELIDATREVTAVPWTVVNTHSHFDHCFGNFVFRPADIWGHQRCAENLVATGELQRGFTVERALAADKPEFAAQIAAVTIVPPDQTFTDEAVLNVGGRQVTLRFLGRGHTDNDIVVEISDAAAIFVGDLVEESAAPAFDDAFPLEWPSTAAALLPLAPGPVVPGHGAVVDRGFVETQAGDLAQAADCARIAYAAGKSVDDSWRELPFPEYESRTALARAFWQLDAAHTH